MKGQRLSPTDLAAISDEEVIAQVLAGDTRLFELIMRRHNQRLFHAARAILRDDGEAEDVMQETYVRAFEHLASFAGRAQLGTWLTRIAVHEALARLRRRSRRRQLPDDDTAEAAEIMNGLPQDGRDPETRAFDYELRRMLEVAVDSLPASLRSVFMLRVVAGMSTAETAEILGVAVQTVKTRLFRARAALQKMLLERSEAASVRAFFFAGDPCDRVVAAAMARIIAGQLVVKARDAKPAPRRAGKTTGRRPN